MKAGIKSLLRGAKKGDTLVCTTPATARMCRTTMGTRPMGGRDSVSHRPQLGRHDERRLLRDTFDTLPADVSFTVIMDCCHSGRTHAPIQPPDVKVKQRYLPSPWAIGAAESGRSLPRNVTSELRRSPPVGA
jgi:hypothetical protein